MGDLNILIKGNIEHLTMGKNVENIKPFKRSYYGDVELGNIGPWEHTLLCKL